MTLRLFHLTYCQPRRLSLWINPNQRSRVLTQLVGHANCHEQHWDQRMSLETLCVCNQHLRANVHVVQMNLTVYCQPWTPLVWEALTFGRANTKLATIMNERRNSRGPSIVSPTKVCCVDCVGNIIKLHAINQELGPASLARKDKVLKHSGCTLLL